jgi:hypothetical protein
LLLRAPDQHIAQGLPITPNGADVALLMALMFKERVAGFFERCLLGDAQDLRFVDPDGIQHLLRA